MAIQHVEARALTALDLAAIEALERDGLFPLRDVEAESFSKLNLKLSDVLNANLEFSQEASLVFVNDELIGVWGHGVRNIGAGVGTAWIVACPAADLHKLWFARSSRRAIEYLLTIYNRIEVLVDAGYFKSQRWLKWLGFEYSTSSVLIKGKPYMFMWLERKSRWPS